MNYLPISVRRVVIIALGMVVPVLAWLVTRSASEAQSAKQKAPLTEFECRFTDTPIKITGKGTDPAWKHAQVIDNFYLPWLGDKARPAKTKTKAKLLWDREHLYFFADMED